MYKFKYRCKPEMIFTKQLWRKLATFTCGLHILSVFFIIKNDFHERFPQLSKRKRTNNLHANSQIHVAYTQTKPSLHCHLPQMTTHIHQQLQSKNSPEHAYAQAFTHCE